MMFRVLAIAVSWLALVRGGGLGIPGTSSTNSGYDTELGTDPICWSGRSSASTNNLFLEDNETKSEEVTVTPFPNKLVADFQLYGETELNAECPEGTWLYGFIPSEFGTPPEYKDGIRPRAGTWYNYRVTGQIDLRNLDGDYIVSDDGTATTAQVTLQVLLCEHGRSGFCSPFIHEQSNARLARNNITQKVKTGERHGGTHVHSPYVFLNVSSSQPVQNFDVEVPMLIQEEGNFFGIAAMNLFTSDKPNGVAQYRYDVGNALDHRLVSYQAPANILEVSTGAEVTSYVCSVLACLVILFLLFQTVKHRSTRVIQLSQGSFLVVMLLAALVASATVFLLNPKSDLYCNLSHPMILISMQLLYSVTIARLWRINIVISPLLFARMEPQKNLSSKFFHLIASLVSCCGRRSTQSSKRRSSLRRSVSDVQLGGVVVLFTMPQVIMQILSLTLQPNRLVVDYNSDESVGRQTCSAYSGEQRLNPGQSLETYAVLLLLVTLIMLMIVATQSRKLPSLFNETRSIFDSTLISILVMLLGIGVIAVTYAPTTSPDVEYMVFVITVLCVTLNSTLRIMLPKLKKIWRGETVVVSRLVSDYKADQLRKKERRVSQDKVQVTGFIVPSGTSPPVSSIKEEPPQVTEETEDTAIASSGAVNQQVHDEENGQVEGEDSKDEFQEEENVEELQRASSRRPSFGLDSLMQVSKAKSWRSRPSRAVSTPQLAVRQVEESRETAHSSVLEDSANLAGYLGNLRNNQQRSPIVIKDNETPTRRLVLPMFELQRMLDQINKRITSGSVVRHEEWVSLKEACLDMGVTFDQDVSFEWENNGANNSA